ncbi:hypothetical protein [Novosphingobium sp. RL4]|uniref:hypothetical protein n=1 Tax=Novosphingobium sp. RL4 TaxID=3109595 RepID=UPI002D7931BC|nr:hypothetical protein [Novosphingobium sp. RL4]WRT92467.1 hypothetical protein U9J33_14850 [Novosphingobium sp. RL4]
MKRRKPGLASAGQALENLLLKGRMRHFAAHTISRRSAIKLRSGASYGRTDRGNRVRSVGPEATVGPNKHGIGIGIAFLLLLFALAVQDQRSGLAREATAPERDFGSDIHFRLSSLEEERGYDGKVPDDRAN